MELLYTIGLGLCFVLAGGAIALGLYTAIYHLLPWADRALARMLYSDIEDEHASKWERRNG